MDKLPKIIVEFDLTTRNVYVSFDTDIPKIVKFHLKHKLHNLFVCRQMNKELIQSVEREIVLELKYLIVTGQLYIFDGQWVFSKWKDEVEYNYNMLNFQ